MEIQKQIKLLKKYGVKSYAVENGKITINGNLWLGLLTITPKGLLEDVTIKGNLDLDSLTAVPEGFLEGAAINGWLNLRSLTTAPEGLLRGAMISGYLNLRSLIEFPDDLFIDTIIKSKKLHLNAKTATKAIVENIYKNSPNADIRFYC